MPLTAAIVRAARQLLEAAGRPLNVRRLLALGHADGTLPAELTVDGLVSALTEADGIRAVRGQVFGLVAPDDAERAPAPARRRPSRAQAEAPAAAEPAAPEADGLLALDDDGDGDSDGRGFESPDDDDDDRGDRDARRRRRPRSMDLVGDVPAAPLTIEAATRDARRGRHDRDALRQSMWERVRVQAAVAAGMTPGPAQPRPAVVRAEAPAEQQAAPATAPRPEPAAERPRRAPAPEPVAVPERVAAPEPVAAPAPAAPPAAPAMVEAAEPPPPRRRRRTPGPVADAASPAAAPAPGGGPAADAAAPDTAGGDPSALIKARLRRRRPVEADAASQPAAAAPPASVPTLQGPAVAADRDERPYVEARRQADGLPPVERRHPALPELASSDVVLDAAEVALNAAGGPLSVASLTAAIERAGVPTEGLSGVLRADAARRAAAGLRPRFARDADGAVTLVAWALSAHFLALEVTLHETLAAQREATRRDLLAKVGRTSATGFLRVLRLLLEREGLTGLEVVHQSGHSLALTGTQSASGERLVVLAHQAWTPLGGQTVAALAANLGAFEADRALVMTLGPLTDAAHAAAAGLPVTLIDGEALAHRLAAQSVGLAEHRPAVRYVDGAFFAEIA